jgi:hypothetical protein
VESPGPLGALPHAAAIEDALRVVPGVVGAHVVTDPAGTPHVLRLELAEAADEVAVARAVHRILRLQFGVGLDPARIEIVDGSTASPQVPAPRLRLIAGHRSHDDVADLLRGWDPGPGPRFDAEALASAARHPAGSSYDATVDLRAAEPAAPATSDLVGHLAIARLALVSDGDVVSATVTLVQDGRDHVGTAQGAPDPTSVQRTVASAALAAVSSGVPSAGRLDVDAVAVVPLAHAEVAVVQVVWLRPAGGERLTGASEVRDDAHQAVIRATLDAVNRRLAPYLAHR